MKIYRDGELIGADEARELIERHGIEQALNRHNGMPADVTAAHVANAKSIKVEACFSIPVLLIDGIGIVLAGQAKSRPAEAVGADDSAWVVEA